MIPDLAAFLAATRGLAPDDFTAALRDHARLYGAWIEPGPGQCGRRPVSHLHEISLFGAYGEGASQAEAVTSWRIAAERIVAAEDAA